MPILGDDGVDWREFSMAERPRWRVFIESQAADSVGCLGHCQACTQVDVLQDSRSTLRVLEILEVEGFDGFHEEG